MDSAGETGVLGDVSAVWMERLTQVLLGAFQTSSVPKGLLHYFVGARHNS